MNKIAGYVIVIVLLLLAPFAKQYAHGQMSIQIPEPKTEQRDNVLIIKEDFGGAMTTYMIRYLDMRGKSEKLAIDGECDSSCTLFFGYIPQQNICITPNAKLGFHRSSRPEGTTVMLMNYPQPVLMWLMATGITEDIKYLPPEIMRAMFRECPKELIEPPAKPQGEKVE